jgi:myo-inositol 2-dehydrogenase / D-chiro-inositol 1-dehydrogenase
VTAVLGVGILGCGPVTQAIHLPALATLADRLRVVHVMDVDPVAAAAVGERVGARHTTDADAVLADPEVDVVAICSPHDVHAEQVEAACAAGKRAILCEKPLAVEESEVDRIVAASRESGVPVIVGTMHVYDPAVVAAMRCWEERDSRPHFVRSLIALPPNERFIDFATEMHSPPEAPAPPNGAAGAAAVRAWMLQMGILALATHNLPLVRRFADGIDDVAGPRLLRPFGYDITYRSGDCTVQLLACFHGHWRPDWTLEVWADGQELRAEFPPSYVLAGSAITTLRRADGERRWHSDENGYQREWRHLADVAMQLREPEVGIGVAADDLRYALRLAAAATHRMEPA